LKVKLYDKETLDLPLFNNFDERVNFIFEKVFLDNKYKKYYNICALDLKKKQIKNIEKRWLGIKKVNSPFPVETLKTTLDYLTRYFLGAKDYSTRHLENKYFELRKKHRNNKLNQQEKQEFYALKDKIIYENRDFVFFYNEKMENKLKNTLETLKNKQIIDYTDNFMIENIKNRLENCEKIKENVQIYLENIGNLQIEKDSICDSINKDYHLFQETKDENLLNSILKLANKLKEINKEIRYSIDKVKQEHDEYLLCIELIYKIK